ncbi:DUF4062 domain-containing protein [Abyssisolibacter fermentans]|uniref:DUF4062 domain-containing protein n=1 Tax=Abyssisolibacter fermentans TaxID=1766203 RepID=UPI00082D68B4|nr:DUF4062 domain-containing protein [Abyssisolibacter fermentans]
MAIPKVFVSSTCYDLKYIRENIKYFIKTIGYEHVLSEDGEIFYNPSMHTHDACLAEVPNCQIFILIIGGRFGGKYKNEEYSVTNAEFKEAVKLRIPIFTLVEQSVYSEHLIYLKNKENEHVNEKKIVYPNVDNIKIFDFIDEVRKNSVNNALVPFKDFNDIEEYMKKQLAGMMYSFLTKQNEEKRISDTLSMITNMNERIEMLSKQILHSVGTKEAKITADLFEKMLDYNCVKDFMAWGIKPTVNSILKNETFKNFLDYSQIEIHTAGDKYGDSYGDKYYIVNREGNIIISGDGADEFVKNTKADFNEMRNKLKSMINESGITIESFLSKS